MSLLVRAFLQAVASLFVFFLGFWQVRFSCPFAAACLFGPFSRACLFACPSSRCPPVRLPFPRRLTCGTCFFADPGFAVPSSFSSFSYLAGAFWLPCCRRFPGRLSFSPACLAALFSPPACSAALFSPPACALSVLCSVVLSECLCFRAATAAGLSVFSVLVCASSLSPPPLSFSSSFLLSFSFFLSFVVARVLVLVSPS